MKKHNIIARITVLITLVFLTCLSISCNKQQGAEITDARILIEPINSSSMTRAGNELTGEFFLGYKSSAGQEQLHDLTLSDGAIVGAIMSGTSYESGLYWVNVAKNSPDNTKSFFTLSNVDENESGNMVFPTDKNILWGSYTAWQQPLKFALSHRMAQVKVILTLSISANVNAVSISAIKQAYTFDREIGVVTAADPATELMLTKNDADGSWEMLLPPQNRTDQMELKVVMSNGKTYKRKLPYSMDQSLGGGNWESIPLVFRQGHILELTATVTENIDYTIFLTGATLKEWIYIGNQSSVVKPAGIYTETELNDWTKKYNSYIGDKSENNHKALLRYGVYTSGGNPEWDFIISRNINVTNPGSLTPITIFNDKLSKLNNYKITGISASALITAQGTGASVDPAIF